MAFGEELGIRDVADVNESALVETGSNLHMVVLHRGKATYWVVNTLLDSLSNETMLAIAKGLKPLTGGK